MVLMSSVRTYGIKERIGLIVKSKAATMGARAASPDSAEKTVRTSAEQPAGSIPPS